jgi:hypothetical protein
LFRIFGIAFLNYNLLDVLSDKVITLFSIVIGASLSIPVNKIKKKEQAKINFSN